MIVKGFSTLTLEPWPFPIHELPAHTYLVGGSVRDALMGRRRDYLDLDFVLAEGAVETASTIAGLHHAGFTVLDAERQIARVVFDHATADFALQEGETLAIDLFRRDFTINAIAYDPHNGQLIDPVHGCADLQRGIVRMIARNNLRDDPLRLLRAYRQAAQLEFTLEPSTQEAIRELAPISQPLQQNEYKLSYFIYCDRPWEPHGYIKHGKTDYSGIGCPVPERTALIKSLKLINGY